jgi:hypothetical protein
MSLLLQIYMVPALWLVFAPKGRGEIIDRPSNYLENTTKKFTYLEKDIYIYYPINQSLCFRVMLDLLVYNSFIICSYVLVYDWSPVNH